MAWLGICWRVLMQTTFIMMNTHILLKRSTNPMKMNKTRNRQTKQDR